MLTATSVESSLVQVPLPWSSGSTSARLALSGPIADVPIFIHPRQEEASAWPLVRRVADLFTPPTHALIPAELATRLRTGALGDELYDETYPILVTRERPVGVPEGAVDAWWPMLAPSHRLLRTRRGPEGERLPWALFAARYWAELSSLPRSIQDSYIVRLGELLRRMPSVTLLSTERSRGRPETEVRSQRRVLRAWLLGETVL
jgi:uncharacterized protein YeaO (DUF488 family)